MLDCSTSQLRCSSPTDFLITSASHPNRLCHLQWHLDICFLRVHSFTPGYILIPFRNNYCVLPNSAVSSLTLYPKLDISQDTLSGRLVVFITVFGSIENPDGHTRHSYSGDHTAVNTPLIVMWPI